MPSIYLYLDGEQKGPYFPGQLRSMLAEGTITAETPAWYEGLADWSSVGAVLAALPEASGPPPVPPSAMPKPRPAAKSQGMSGGLIAAIIGGVLLILAVPCCAGIALGPITHGIEKAKENAAMQTARAIGFALSAYAADHNGQYPDGGTSTEVFQKLVDGGYVANPSLFCGIMMPGKTRATSKHLTAENVSFDVTSGVTTDSPGELPLVFSTGYTVDYSLGGTIMPDTSGPPSPFPGIAVAYRNNTARFWGFPRGTTTIQLMPQGFDLKGRTYQQLKP